jgi:hypothetical protein
MQKLKTFFYSITRSVTSPEYYADILKARLSFSIKYLVFLQFLLALFTTAFFMAVVALFDLSGVITNLKSSYPRDLVVRYQDGKLLLNQTTPFRIPLQRVLDAAASEDFRYLLTYESDENIRGAADVLAQQSFIVATETTVYVRDDEQSGMQTFLYDKQIEDTEVRSETIDGWLHGVENSPIVTQKWYVPLAGLLIFVILFSLFVLSALIVAAVYGVVVWVLGKLFAEQLLAGQTLSFVKAFQVVIHSMTLTSLLQVIVNTVAQSDVFSGLLYIVATVSWTVFLLYRTFHPTQKESK